MLSCLRSSRFSSTSGFGSGEGRSSIRRVPMSGASGFTISSIWSMIVGLLIMGPPVLHSIDQKL